VWKVTVQEKKWALTEGLDPEGYFDTEKEKKIMKKMRRTWLKLSEM